MQAFIARQPIFDRQLNVFGYELLFRSGLTNEFPHTDGDNASASLISDSLLTIGIDELTSGRKAFINFTQNALTQKMPYLLSPETVVIEILETVIPDREIIQNCRTLKEAGYCLALDDLTTVAEGVPYAGLIDIVKIDFKQTTPAQRKECVDAFRLQNVACLAEKVETPEEFDAAMALGFDYFQGYFFSKPNIIAQTRIEEAHPARVALLQAVHKPSIEFGEIESILRQDVGLTYRLLKYINSAFFGLREQVHSIRQALTLLGLNNIRRWISLIALESMGEGKPSQLIVESLVRARFCELLSAPLGMPGCGEDLFLTGLLSMIDAILDRPMEAVLEEIPVDEIIHKTLLGERTTLRHILEVATAYQQGDWLLFDAQRDMLRFSETQIPPLYYEAVRTADALLQTTDTTAPA